MELFNDDVIQGSFFKDYIERKDYKGAVDYMRNTPFVTVNAEVLRAGYSVIGRNDGLNQYIDHVMRQVIR